jgi:hypothetical protein
MSKLEISKIDGSIAIRKQNKDGVTFTPYTYHKISSIRSVFPDFYEDFKNVAQTYPYQDKLRVILTFVSENQTKEDFDIQDVINQAGWTNDEAGLLQALSDINGWLSTAGSIISGGEFEPNAIDLSGETFPYDFPASQYSAFVLVIADGITIDFNGVTLPSGSYPFSGSGGQKSKTFELSNPSATPNGCFILTIE